jgi:cation-transporting ATPase E
MARGNDVPLDEARTVATVVLLVYGLWILTLLARPFNWWRGLLVGAMVLAFVLVLAIPPLADFYALTLPDWDVVAEALVLDVVAAALLHVALRFTRAAPAPVVAVPHT